MMFNPFMSGIGSMYGGMYGNLFSPFFNTNPYMSGIGSMSPFGSMMPNYNMSPYGGMPNYGMFGGIMNPFMNPFMNTQPTPNQLPADAVTTEYRPREAAPFQQGPDAVDDGTLLSSTFGPAMPVPGALAIVIAPDL